MLEDMGYYCVDNLPIQLLKSVVELAENGAFDEKIVVGIDVRNGRAMKLLLTLSAASLWSAVLKQQVFQQSRSLSWPA